MFNFVLWCQQVWACSGDLSSLMEPSVKNSWTGWILFCLWPMPEVKGSQLSVSKTTVFPTSALCCLS